MKLEVILQRSSDNLMGALRKPVCIVICGMCAYVCECAHVEARGQGPISSSLSTLFGRQGLSRSLELSDWLSATMSCRTRLLKHPQPRTHLTTTPRNAWVTGGLWYAWI